MPVSTASRDLRDVLDLKLRTSGDAPLVVTQSDIRAYKTCRRSWLLATVFGLSLRDAPMFGPAHLGTRLHLALYYYYADGADLVETYNALVARERDVLEASGAVYGLDTFAREADIGRKMLEGYLEWIAETGADSDLKIIGAESRLSYNFETAHGTVELRGKVDLRAQRLSDGARLIVDHKTTAAFSNITTTAHKNEQVLTYMLLERLVNANTPESWLRGAMFNLLRRVSRTVNAKPPFYDRVEVSHGTLALRSFYTRTHGVLQDYARSVHAIEQGQPLTHVAYPTAGTQCRYCPFRSMCDMMDDGSRAEDMAQALYVQNDPHARYNEELAGELIAEVAAN